MDEEKQFPFEKDLTNWLKDKYGFEQTTRLVGNLKEPLSCIFKNRHGYLIRMEISKEETDEDRK